MRIDFLTLFPEMCMTVMGQSIIGRAVEKGILDIACHNMRDYTTNKQKQVDDAPFGGGMGMVIQAQPVYDCYLAVKEKFPKKSHKHSKSSLSSQPPILSKIPSYS